MPRLSPVVLFATLLLLLTARTGQAQYGKVPADFLEVRSPSAELLKELPNPDLTVSSEPAAWFYPQFTSRDEVRRRHLKCIGFSVRYFFRLDSLIQPKLSAAQAFYRTTVVRVQYTCNSDGNLLEYTEHEMTLPDSALIQVCRLTQTYDRNGRVIFWRWQSLPARPLLPELQSELAHQYGNQSQTAWIQYDAQGRKVSWLKRTDQMRTIEQRGLNDPRERELAQTSYRRWLYTYDPATGLLSRTRYWGSTDSAALYQPGAQYRETRIYHTANRRLRAQLQLMENDSGSTSWRLTDYAYETVRGLPQTTITEWVTPYAEADSARLLRELAQRTAPLPLTGPFADSYHRLIDVRDRAGRVSHLASTRDAEPSEFILCDYDQNMITESWFKPTGGGSQLLRQFDRGLPTCELYVSELGERSAVVKAFFRPLANPTGATYQLTQKQRTSLQAGTRRGQSFSRMVRPSYYYLADQLVEIRSVLHQNVFLEDCLTGEAGRKAIRQILLTGKYRSKPLKPFRYQVLTDFVFTTE